MNMDNNNLENSFGSESAGVTNPVNNEPINNQGDTFSPFEDLNNAPLNVPTETLEQVQTTPEIQSTPEPSFFQPGAEVNSTPIDTLGEVNQTPSFDTLNQTPQSNIDALNDALNPAPQVNNNIEMPSQTFETTQSAPTIEEFTAPDAFINVEPAQAVENTFVNDNLNSPVNDFNSANVAPAPVMDAPATNLQQGPTIPIPDQMPTTDYQAGVSTPVDYATPMSDFDQIGTTPELDPKAKGNKKSNKLALVVLLLAVIGGLGYGAYYFINVKGILDKNSVSVKEVTAEKNEILSVNIDDYATFKNTSSSNCVLDTSKVDVSTIGSYEFTITCGKKSYTGKVNIKDTKGPDVVIKTSVVNAGTTLTADMLIENANENATYAYSSDAEASKFQTAGLKIIEVVATDDNSNSKKYFVPVIVTSSEYSMGIVAKMNVSNDNTIANITEKNVILYNNGGGMFNDTSYTAYIIKFNDQASYNAAIKNYDNTQTFTYETYTGTPVFYSQENTLVLVKDINTELIKPEFNETFTNLRNSGYETISINQISYKELIDFNR